MEMDIKEFITNNYNYISAIATNEYNKEQNQNMEPLLKTEASIVNNQVRPKPIDPDTLRSKSVSLVCPFCKSQINTSARYR